MKKFIGSLIVAASLLFTATVQAEDINPNANSNVVYYIPHQDDEALTFGVSIMNHIRGGHNVHVVLLTDGAGSGIKTRLGMTAEDFQEARNKEFAYSLAIMGVDPANIEYTNFKDGTLTAAQMESVVKRYEAQFPNAKHKAFSYTDGHNDHNIGGKTLKKLNTAGIISDARYFVRQQDNPSGVRLMKEPWNEDFRPILLAVSSAYEIQNEALGFYGIGHLSVKTSFASFEKQPISRYHK